MTQKYQAALDQLISEEKESLAAVYWLGSLAHGGFSEFFSDIDIALIYQVLPAPWIMEEKISRWKRVLPEGKKWSFFWTDQKFQGGRFPVPDIIDLLDNGKLIFGCAVHPPRPDLDDLHTYLRSHSIPYWSELAKKGDWSDPKTRVRLALYPARFLYSWVTGKISSNEEAVSFALSSNWPVEPGLLENALKARETGKVSDLDQDSIVRQLENVFQRARHE